MHWELPLVHPRLSDRPSSVRNARREPRAVRNARREPRRRSWTPGASPSTRPPPPPCRSRSRSPRARAPPAARYGSWTASPARRSAWRSTSGRAAPPEGAAHDPRRRTPGRRREVPRGSRRGEERGPGGAADLRRPGARRRQQPRHRFQPGPVRPVRARFDDEGPHLRRPHREEGRRARGLRARPEVPHRRQAVPHPRDRWPTTFWRPYRTDPIPTRRASSAWPTPAPATAQRPAPLSYVWPTIDHLGGKTERDDAPPPPYDRTRRPYGTGPGR